MTILAGKLSEDSSVLNVNLLHNPLNVSVVSTEEITTGEYIVTIDKPVLNENMPPKWYISNSSGNIYAVASQSPVTFTVQCFNPPATPVSNTLTGAEFQIETY